MPCGSADGDVAATQCPSRPCPCPRPDAAEDHSNVVEACTACTAYLLLNWLKCEDGRNCDLQPNMPKPKPKLVTLP